MASTEATLEQVGLLPASNKVCVCQEENRSYKYYYIMMGIKESVELSKEKPREPLIEIR